MVYRDHLILASVEEEQVVEFPTARAEVVDRKVLEEVRPQAIQIRMPPPGGEKIEAERGGPHT